MKRLVSLWLAAGAATASAYSARYVDPYPDIYPQAARPDPPKTSAIYTGPKAKGGGHRGWIDVDTFLSPAQAVAGASAAATATTNATIWIGIAAFRDNLCGLTLKRLFTKAESPERITVGLVQQNLPDDPDCVQEMCRILTAADPERGLALCRRYIAQVTTFNMNANEAQGPLQARSIQSRMVPPPLADAEAEASSFCMQVDSHMVSECVSEWVSG